MSIIRRKRTHSFAAIPNAVIRDERLSFAERGLLIYLLSQPDDWRVQIADLQKQGGIGRDAAYKLLKNLIELRYVEREAVRDPNSNRIVRMDYTVSDEPLPEKPEVEGGPLPETPYTENQDAVLRTDNNKYPPLPPKAGPADLLGATLDQVHVAAIVEDRKRHGLPLDTSDAQAIARHCGAYLDPNTEAEALIARRYRGCKGLRRLPAQADASPAGERGRPPPLPPGYIVRAAEPEAYERALVLSGEHRSAASEAKAWRFAPEIAAKARSRSEVGA